MKRFAPALAATAAFLALASSASAQEAPKLKPELAGLSFLVGEWSNGQGAVADTGGTSTGSSKITVEAGGGALLRKDHTELFDKAGKPTGGFDQIMLIYPEGGAIHADYSDGAHVIHYVSAKVTPGKFAVFSTAASPGAPAFRLAYVLSDPRTLAIAFSMAPPGSTTFKTIAAGAVTKAP